MRQIKIVKKKNFNFVQTFCVQPEMKKWKNFK